ncbi:MAG: hypothetical protein H7835_07935, partial [Magnetococcus sp. XQGC-1]
PNGKNHLINKMTNWLVGLSEYRVDELKDFSRLEKEQHASISADVYQRLLLRHTVLVITIKLVQEDHRISKVGNCDEFTKKSFPDYSILDPAIKPKIDQGAVAYRLAVTDLFVEKAIAYLEKQANEYKMYGKILYVCAMITVVFGVCLSVFTHLNASDSKLHIEELSKLSEIFIENKESFFSQSIGKIQHEPKAEAAKQNTKDLVELFKIIMKDKEYLVAQVRNDMVASFVRAFTMYGMIVLTVVGFSRYGKAMLDQSERLFEKRHALRQGRLFVHLNSGELTIEELEKAFNWNQTQPNAFGEMPTDSSAPWGSVVNEVVKTSLNAMKKSKTEPEKTDKK